MQESAQSELLNVVAEFDEEEKLGPCIMDMLEVLAKVLDRIERKIDENICP